MAIVGLGLMGAQPNKVEFLAQICILMVFRGKHFRFVSDKCHLHCENIQYIFRTAATYRTLCCWSPLGFPLGQRK
jgi:hypothetical protein